jgi:hypothetical protein
VKNIQIIDGGLNCTYDIYAATDDEFKLIFLDETDVEFAEDVFDRLGEQVATELMRQIWTRPVARKDVIGIHGTMFYQLEKKKRYYPTKKQSEMTV